MSFSLKSRVGLIGVKIGLVKISLSHVKLVWGKYIIELLLACCTCCNCCKINLSCCLVWLRIFVRIDIEWSTCDFPINNRSKWRWGPIQSGLAHPITPIAASAVVSNCVRSISHNLTVWVCVAIYSKSISVIWLTTNNQGRFWGCVRINFSRMSCCSLQLRATQTSMCLSSWNWNLGWVLGPHLRILLLKFWFFKFRNLKFWNSHKFETTRTSS